VKKCGVAEGPEFYDSAHGRYKKRPKLMRPDWDRFRALAEEISKYVVGSVLDLGCGLGFLAEFVKGPYIGVDFSPVSIQMAKEWNTNPSAEFILADIRHFEPSITFDTITAIEVMEHLDNPFQAAELAKRLALKRIVISVPRHMPGGSHVWPTWTGDDVIRLLGPGTEVYRYRRWRIGVWKANATID
jgi:2-polyprenyl-3-methyl-5-hydroxy-6-metoxy-1,4-benzoquinol methylase